MRMTVKIFSMFKLHENSLHKKKRVSLNSFGTIGINQNSKNKRSTLSSKAMRNFILFEISYLFENEFSAVAEIKSKYRSNNNVEQEMRIAMSLLIPHFE